MLGVIPVSIHSASEDVVRYALAIFKLMSHCTQTNLYCSLHYVDPYRSAICKGKMAPLYIVAIASSFSPQDIFAALDKLYVIFVHLSAMYVMCS